MFKLRFCVVSLSCLSFAGLGLLHKGSTPEVTSQEAALSSLISQRSNTFSLDDDDEDVADGGSISHLIDEGDISHGGVSSTSDDDEEHVAPLSTSGDDADSINHMIDAGDLESSVGNVNIDDAGELNKPPAEPSQRQEDTPATESLDLSRDAGSDDLAAPDDDAGSIFVKRDVEPDIETDIEPVLPAQPEPEPDPSWNGHECKIPQCTYINLDRRTDRKTFAEGELSKADVGCQRLSAVDAKKKRKMNPVDASRYSHINALKRLRASNAPYGLILEDDAEWQYDKIKIEKHLCNVQDGLKSHPVILLACNLDGNPLGDDCENKWLKRVVGNCQTATAYIVRHDYVPTLIKFFQNQGPGTFIDQAWKPLQEKDDWAMTWPTLVKQHPFYSDIEEKMVDYGVFLSRPSPVHNFTAR